RAEALLDHDGLVGDLAFGPAGVEPGEHLGGVPDTHPAVRVALLRGAGEVNAVLAGPAGQLVALSLDERAEALAEAGLERQPRVLEGGRPARRDDRVRAFKKRRSQGDALVGGAGLVARLV